MANEKVTEKTMKMVGIPSIIHDIETAMNCLVMGRDYTCIADEQTNERYAVAIRSLGRHVLELVESRYTQEEKEYTCDVEIVDTTYQQKVVVAKDEEEAKRKVVDQMVQDDGMNPDIVYNVTRVKEAK